MGRPTLPNPDMDFTPLDILTASDMDKIVANIQYVNQYAGRVADGTEINLNSIDGSKIKDGSVDPAKLKSGSIPFLGASPTTHNLAVGYGYTVTLTKFGKLVFVSSTGIANVAGTGSRGERIPEGWRPAHNTPLIGIAVNNTNFTGAFSLILGSDGSIQWQGARGHNEYHISAVYLLA